VAANYIESTLARSLSVAINFLARQVGLGNVGQKVRDIIRRVQDKINAAMNKLIEYVDQQGKSWLAKAGGVRQNTAGGSKKPGGVQRPVPANRPAGQPPAQRTQQLGNFTVKHRFTMSGEQHHLIAQYRQKNLNLLIASDPKQLIPALTEAIRKLDTAIKSMEATKSPLSSDKQKDLARKKDSASMLKSALKQAENVEWTVKSNINQITAQYRTGQDYQAQQQAIDKEILKGLAKLANQIQQAASTIGIKDLDELDVLRDYYKAPPTKRYLPIPSGVTPSEFIRSKLYGQWASVRGTFSKNEEPNVIKKIESVQAMPDGSAKNTRWAQLRRAGIVEPKYTGAINAYKPDSIKYEVDHIIPIAKMWNEAGTWKSGKSWGEAGNNTDDKTRYNQMSEATNLQVVTEQYNRSKSSGGEFYERFVLAKFTSDKAASGIAGALTFDGEPFRDAAGNSLK
jgi:hypothetical protein